VPLVIKPIAFACRAERLARATASPDGAITRPSGKVEGECPATEAREEVALGIPGKIIWGDFFDAPRVHETGGDVTCVDEVS
jgi:hypothetical protein